jgi:hypothetical protein
MTVGTDAVVLEYSSSGTMTQSELEVAIPDYFRGKPYTLHHATRITVQDGKITSEMTWFDQVRSSGKWDFLISTKAVAVRFQVFFVA